MRFGLSLLLALGLTGCGARTDSLKTHQAYRARPAHVALFTSLPILWGEESDLRGFLRTDTAPHWALAVLRNHGELRPLDALLPDQLRASRFLIMAQPRPLSPSENVALDQWVRRGGHLLLFADPMLTQDSHYAFGDKRRPQDIVMLSPILMRWGLDLTFDDSQMQGEKWVALSPKITLPVNLPGQFVARRCSVIANGLASRCRIGRGSVLAIADASLFEGEGVQPEQRAAALEALIVQASH